jgi:L-alanine-DL-glutamate epimerase-like enolase superfamily enzyme
VWAVIVEGIRATPLEVPLREPFVIASARMDCTRAALVTVRTPAGVIGIGEAAPLPPVTAEDQPDVLANIERASALFAGLSLDSPEELGPMLDSAFPSLPVTRAAVECALLDALARSRGVPLRRLLGEGSWEAFETDITIPIHSPARMGELAREHRKNGFRCFKVKVGKDRVADERALAAIHAAAPDASVRLDANEGLSPQDALDLLDHARAMGVTVECFEQPCARGDLEAMAFVTARSKVPVIADESLRSLDDLDEIVSRRAAHGVNLKLAKLGGLLAAMTIGRRAKEAGLLVMCGAMVETRLGLCAMAHVASALGGVDFIDLDTAFLLSTDPFVGGWIARGPSLRLTGGPGLDLAMAEV